MNLLADRTAVAIILSAYVNATGLALDLRSLGWHGRIICLRVNGAADLASRWPELCEVHGLEVTDAEGLLHWLAKNFQAVPMAIFFTDERFLSTFAGDQARRLLPLARYHVPPPEWLELIVDRAQFYRFLGTNGIASSARAVPSEVDPFQTFGPNFRVRVWRSYDGLRKLPRGGNVRSADDLDRWRATCAAAGLRADQWGFQELLSTRPEDNLSVCGWHDAEFRFYRTTCRLHAVDEYGSIVAIVPDPAGLGQQAHAILNALDFRGPFEVEFVRDPSSGLYKVIELNPRFWMQHRLVSYHGNGCLLRRYLGLPIEPPTPSRKWKRYWLNTDIALKRLLSREALQVLPYLPRGMWAYPIRGSVRAALRTSRW